MTGQDKTGQDKTGQDRTEQDSTGQNSTGQDRTGQNRTAEDRTAQDRTGQHRTGQDAFEDAFKVCLKRVWCNTNGHNSGVQICSKSSYHVPRSSATIKGGRFEVS